MLCYYLFQHFSDYFNNSSVPFRNMATHTLSILINRISNSCSINTSNMASLVKFGRLSSQLTPRKTGYLYATVRNFKNDDWKPGPYPTTEEERKKAAAKYNLHPLEYEPYPDDGAGSGDYPKLPYKGVELNDPYYPYDFPAIKRNFNEAVHREIDMLGEDRWAAGKKYQYPVWVYYAACFGVIGSFMLVFFWTRDSKMYRPVLEKQYPTPGVTHYTFEPAR